MPRQFKVLISSVGRRAQLIQCFRNAARELGVDLTVLGSDAEPGLSPAAHLVDRSFRVPRCSSPAFVGEMMRICEQEDVQLLVPTIDPELPIYAQNKKHFADIGTTVLISGPKTVEIARDKVATNKWFVDHDFPTVHQTTIDKALAGRIQCRFPVIAKPRQGSASVGVRIVQNEKTLTELAQEEGLIVEEIAQGVEHTTNLLANASGHCICAVPHQRLETRAGEVSKGVTVKNAALMNLVKRVAESFPDAQGPLNIQGFVDKDGAIKLTEINARFGGGFPLACEAGANFCRWIIEDMLGLPSTASFSRWKENLMMLRFDSAVFVDNKDQNA